MMERMVSSSSPHSTKQEVLTGWRIALPGLGNLFLVLLKDTALISVIGLDDLMRQAYVAVGYTKLPFTFYIAAAAIYLLLTIIAMQIIGQLERLASRGIPREIRA